MKNTLIYNKTIAVIHSKDKEELAYKLGADSVV
jgi:hypothetical protein